MNYTLGTKRLLFAFIVCKDNVNLAEKRNDVK